MQAVHVIAHRGSKNKNDGLAPRVAFSSAARTPNRPSPATGDHARPSSSAKTKKRSTYFCVTRTCAVPQELPLEQGARRQCDGIQNSELARMVLGEPLGSHLHSSLLRHSSSWVLLFLSFRSILVLPDRVTGEDDRSSKCSDDGVGNWSM